MVVSEPTSLTGDLETDIMIKKKTILLKISAVTLAAILSLVDTTRKAITVYATKRNKSSAYWNSHGMSWIDISVI